MARHKRSPAIGSDRASGKLQANELKPRNILPQIKKQGWRDQFRVHPAAAVFPPMSDDELAKLGADIKENGLREPPTFSCADEPEMLDGCNRMEAMERCGIPLPTVFALHEGDPVAFIISKNIHRRHLTPKEQLYLITAARIATITACETVAEEKLGHDVPVSKGGRGKVNPLKAAVIADAKAAGLDVSERTIKRTIAKVEGRAPAPKPKRRSVSEHGRTIMKRPLKSKSGPVFSASGIWAARQEYLRCVELVADLDVEREIILEAFREIAGKRAMERPQ